MKKSDHIHPIFDRMIPREKREKMYGHKAKAIWLTGLPGSGKTTLALALEKKWLAGGYLCQLLDGDNVRDGLNSDLGFDEAGRMENIRRVAEVAKIFLRSGIIPICSFVSPLTEMRELARAIIGPSDFYEVYVKAPVEICAERDPKGLYKLAKEGQIADFTGISSGFEPPANPIYTVETNILTVAEACDKVTRFILPNFDF